MHSLNILESMGQAVHFYDHSYIICYWNRAAEQLFGYSVSEALGRCTLGLIIEEQDFNEADKIGRRTAIGQCYTGQFPVRNKQGRRFKVIVTIKPLYDDTGEIIGVVRVSCDSQPFRDIAPVFSKTSPIPEDAYTNASQKPRSGFATTKPCFNTQEILHVVICSKIWKLASRMTKILFSKLIPRVKTMKHEILHGGSSYANPQGFRETNFLDKRNDALQEGSPINSRGDSDDKGKGTISHEMVSYSRAWKGTKQSRFVTRIPTTYGVLYDEQEDDFNRQRSTEPESQIVQCSRFGGNEASGSTFSSFDSASTVTINNSSVCPLHNFDTDADSSDYDISWEDLTFGEQIGQGSSATVFHGLWCGLDVAIKVFLNFENWDGLLSCFREEVLLMKRLRHRNLLLFLGAVTSPPHPCIITEFLPRGSLFQLLHRNFVTMDWRRRVNMALDVARGMNYLHQWDPPIVNCDLKSSNLLVDKNWTVKVGDFGLSRLKHATFLTTKKWRGTTQWMAPEVIRNEPVDEKSDVYSFGVVLWELATLKIPWYGLTPVQVIAAVGFMEQRLEIPKDMNPQWASLIKNCWQRLFTRRKVALRIMASTMAKSPNMRIKPKRLMAKSLTCVYHGGASKVSWLVMMDEFKPSEKLEKEYKKRLCE
ncbi:dual specificity protein kinase shkD-like isoform X1 [Papaver somniferum]|uniref:dual specificity protein kinase shkD-like isoform X1 n=2 Tax=Papaver somniferum TaxID=3469 RepID=UPI000E6F5E3D|nr:dual specificity protein kinase shkD-like isoform X1 [Papaver somniferum]XP_026408696.1 dual specificity protein kinase shkD-like isoform X1 [Papaver somniferum]XP_026408697.1 dual specificity protein kinase shkD-like isoform X1 [Papaver somniferum]